MSGSIQSDEISIRDTVGALRNVATYRPLLTVVIIGLSMLVGVLEGVGVGFILPIVTIAQHGAGGDLSGPVRIFVEAYSTLGIPFTLEYVIVGVSSVLAVRYALGVLIAWLSAVLGTGYRRHLRITGYDLALDARTSYFDEYGSEELLNAVLTQTGYASRVITKVVRLLKTLLVCAAYVLIALYLAPELMLLSGFVLLVFMFGSKYAFESGYDVGDRLASANEQVQGTLQAGIQGIREVKLFSLGDELRGDFQRAVDKQTRASIKQQRDQTALANLNNFFAAVTVFGLVYLSMSVSSLSLASLGVFLFAMLRLAPRLSSLNGLLYNINNDLPHFLRTEEFINRLEENRERWGDEPVPTHIERVDFQNVGFAYPTGDEDVLHDVSFALERDTFVAFVGPSGAGKSTVASLLSGMYRPDRGQILANATPIHRFSSEDWRSRVAVVKQDPHIFNETLRYNLTIGNRNASEKAIETVCDIAQVSEFIDSLPAGYDTVLGDDGVRLSGGQRQRVAIARALLKDADILVLDEATSELDSHLEARVHAGIEQLDRDYTVVAIAHRLSTVTGADVIHVMEDGEIVESGTHQELLDDDGAYADLYDTQLNGSVSPSVSASSSE
jgi:subfamily B ATP-binding cassette protein MsbA